MGTEIWDASIVLLKYFEANASHISFADKSVFEYAIALGPGFGARHCGTESAMGRVQSPVG